MTLYKKFETDADCEKSGILLNYGVNEKGAQINIRIARAGGSNLAYHKKMEEKAKPIKRQLQNGMIDNKEVERITFDVIVETVVLGWEGVEDRDGNDLPFSIENARKLLTDLPDLYRDIAEQANQATLFRRQLQEADSKN